MDNVRPRASSSSPPKGFFHTRSVVRPKSPKPIIKSKWVKKESTAGTQAVLPQTKGEKGSVVTSPTQTWRPKGAYLDHRHKNNGSYTLKKFEYGNPEEELKDHAIIDSGCSGSMTGDKDKLLDFKNYKGGYVAFDDNVADLLTKGFDLARRKKVSHGSTGLNEVDVNSGIAQVNEGTAEVHEGTAEVHEGTDEVHESTAEVYEESPDITTLILESKKDKGKGIMKEEPKKKKVTLQQLRAAETANDEEVARKVVAEWEEEEERKRIAGLERLQAELEDDEMIAAELQRTKRENFTEEQKAKFLVETIAAQRRFRAEQQAALRRSKPPTISQLRNQMMKYIRNVGGKAYKNLRNKSYDEIKDIYEKVKRFNDKFVAIGSKEDEQAVKEMNEKAKKPSEKRKGTIRKMKSSRVIKKRKIQKSDDEPKDFLKVVDFESDSAQAC
ncbi:hypothetical protein Tco_0155425 [Tanacetum coccineum]